MSDFPPLIPAAALPFSGATGGTARPGTRPADNLDPEVKQATLKKACAEFESLFLNYMLKEMRSTVPESGLLSGGKAESVYTEMMDQHLASDIAAKRSIGLASFFHRQLDAADKTDGNAKLGETKHDEKGPR